MEIRTPFSVEGDPILGTYTASSLDDLELVSEVGMNTVIGGKEMLDPGTEVGEFIYDNSMKVLYHLTHRLYGLPRLGDRISPTQTEIPLIHAKRDIPDQGLVQVEGELIRYGESDGESLSDCERGAEGTEALEHHEGIFLFYPRECAERVREVKDSPNLLGYYVLDDSPGDAISALKSMYSTIRGADGDESHPVCAGYGSPGSLCNFGPGVCDLMMIYLYPLSTGGYDRYMISDRLQWMLTAARARVPGIPFVGVYQSYWENEEMKPNPSQIREQAQDFVREGASGLIAFACRLENMGGWSESEPIQKEMARIHNEILTTGKLEVPTQSQRMEEERIQPTGHWESPNDIPGVVPGWHIVSPFDDPDKGRLDTVHPPEEEIDLDAEYSGKYGPIHWIERDSNAGWVGLNALYGQHTLVNDSIGYAACMVESPEPRDTLVGLGSDDDIAVWLNDEMIWKHEGERGLNRDDDSVKVSLPEGRSRLLLKICNRKGMWGFFFRFRDPDGNPMEGLSFEPS